MDLGNRIIVRVLDPETLSFYLKDKQKPFSKNVTRELDIKSTISPYDEVDNSSCFFIVSITNSVIDEAGELLLEFRTRMAYQITNFNISPNQAILEEYVFHAFDKHQLLYHNQIESVPVIDSDNIKRPRLENFEETLRQEFMRYVNGLTNGDSKHG